MTATQPWEPGRATVEIRSIARNAHLNISYKLHARERMAERGLIVSDVLHALKYGNVYQAPIPATRPGHFRYRVECRTPNSGSRSIGVVVHAVAPVHSAAFSSRVICATSERMSGI